MCAQPTQKAEESIFYIRQNRLSEALRQTHLDGLAFNPGPSLTYLTGLHFHLSERPVVALFPQALPPVIILPELETAKLIDLTYPLHAFAYGEDPAGWGGEFARGLAKAGLEGKAVGLDPRQMRVLE